MSEPKFKAGDKAWCVRQGIVTLSGGGIGSYPLTINYGRCGQSGDFDGCTLDGKVVLSDKYPSIYTLDEARAMGFSVPKEKLRVEAHISWHQHATTKEIFFCGLDTAQLVGKHGKMIFEEE